jgi:uncharacterized membrane protein
LNLIRVMPAKGRESMQTSIFLARLLGPVLFVLGLGFTIHRKVYTDMAKEFVANSSLVYLAGVIALTGGLAIILTHNVWTADWRVIVTLLGWAALVSGLVRLLLPELVKRLSRNVLKNERPVLYSGVVWIIVGAMLGYAGYAP